MGQSEKEWATHFSLRDTPMGVVICLVNLMNVRPARESDERRACCPIGPRDNAWLVEMVTPLDPVPVKGKLGLWDIHGSLVTVGGYAVDCRALCAASS